MESGEQVRQFVLDLCRGMRERAWTGPPRPGDPDESSPMKTKYGDTWTFMHGTMNGIFAMKEDGTGHEWERMMETYGYGAHGRGLRLGRRLAFYEPDQFDFTESDSGDSDFVFVDPSDESQFVFIE